MGILVDRVPCEMVLISKEDYLYVVYGSTDPTTDRNGFQSMKVGKHAFLIFSSIKQFLFHKL